MSRAGWLLAAAAVVFAPLPAVAGAVPDCSLMAATPPGGALVVWCATSVRGSTGKVEDVRLWRSGGDGRWVEAKAENVSVNAPPSPPQASPRWAVDHTLYWATSGGLYASTDLGETFSLVSAQITAQQHPARRVVLTDTGTGVRAAVAGYDPHDLGWYTSQAGTTVAFGSPDDDILFVPGPSSAAVLAWDTATAGAHRITAYGCTEQLSCTTPWFSLPAPSDGWAQQPLGAWRRPGAGTGEPTYVAVRDGPSYGHVSVWAATTAPTRLPAAEAIVASVSDGRSAPTVTFAFAGASVLMRVMSWGDRLGSAHDRIYASSDRGTSWRLVSAAETTVAGRATGPWRPGTVSLSFVASLLVRDGVWLANVADGNHYALRCSRDAGKHWANSCSS